jgi:hypothetical protein
MTIRAPYEQDDKSVLLSAQQVEVAADVTDSDG